MWPTPAAPQFGVFVERQVEALRRAGVSVDVLFVNGRESKINYARGVRELRRRLRLKRYDLVHATYVFSGVIARAQVHHPIVVTHTGIEALQSWQAPLCWFVSRVVDEVVVRSEEMKRRIGLPRATVIPSGIDLDVFRPQSQAEARARLGLSTEGRIVLFVGEPRPEKRLDIVEGAVARLRADGSDVELVTVCGKPQAEVPLFLNAADVLVLPSENEGSPGAVKEAMACNVPVIATDVGDVAERVAHTDGCYLAERSAEDFAEKMRLVFERGGRTRGRDAVAELAWPRVTEKLLEVYERAARPRA